MRKTVFHLNARLTSSASCLVVRRANLKRERRVVGWHASRTRKIETFNCIGSNYADLLTRFRLSKWFLYIEHFDNYGEIKLYSPQSANLSLSAVMAKKIRRYRQFTDEEITFIRELRDFSYKLT